VSENIDEWSEEKTAAAGTFLIAYVLFWNWLIGFVRSNYCEPYPLLQDSFSCVNIWASIIAGEANIIHVFSGVLWYHAAVFFVVIIGGGLVYAGIVYVDALGTALHRNLINRCNGDTG